MSNLEQYKFVVTIWLEFLSFQNMKHKKATSVVDFSKFCQMFFKCVLKDFQIDKNGIGLDSTKALSDLLSKTSLVASMACIRD